MKTLSEKIAEHVLRSVPGGSARNRATFILMREDVRNAMERGYSVLAIWQFLREEGQISFGYQAFRRYTKSLIKPNKDTI
jgi:hypothetical protein